MSKASKLIIQLECPKCQGHGKIRSAELEETFTAIPKTGVTALELHAASQKVGNSTAQNARLERLRRLKLVTRHREGKCFRYFRA